MTPNERDKKKRRRRDVLLAWVANRRWSFWVTSGRFEPQRHRVHRENHKGNHLGRVGEPIEML